MREKKCELINTENKISYDVSLDLSLWSDYGDIIVSHGADDATMYYVMARVTSINRFIIDLQSNL